MRRFSWLLLLLVGSNLSTISFAEEVKNRLVGRPITKASCDESGCTHDRLSSDDQAKYELVVSRAGDRYYWTSREGTLLQKTESGAFTFYLSPEGSGYVKLTTLNGKCEYMEHLTLHLSSISYWGVCQIQ